MFLKHFFISFYKGFPLIATYSMLGESKTTAIPSTSPWYFISQSQVTCPWSELIHISNYLQILDWILKLSSHWNHLPSVWFQNTPMPIIYHQRLQIIWPQCGLSLGIFKYPQMILMCNQVWESLVYRNIY